jgi:hypothetical protein
VPHTRLADRADVSDQPLRSTVSAATTMKPSRPEVELEGLEDGLRAITAVDEAREVPLSKTVSGSLSVALMTEHAAQIGGVLSWTDMVRPPQPDLQSVWFRQSVVHDGGPRQCMRQMLPLCHADLGIRRPERLV